MATTEKDAGRVQNMILDYGRLKVYETGRVVGIREEREQNILLEELSIRKRCTRWASHLAHEVSFIDVFQNETYGSNNTSAVSFEKFIGLSDSVFLLN